MRIRIIAILFICFCSIKSFSQSKYPVYILGSEILNLDSNRNIRCFQFFSDSTFLLTNYQSRKYHIIKSEIRGRYSKQADTLILNDANSTFNISNKNLDNFKELAKDELMQLFPAKIIMTKGESQYLSYLNIPRKIYANTYWAIIELDKVHKQKQKHYGETRMIQF